MTTLEKLSPTSPRHTIRNRRGPDGDRSGLWWMITAIALAVTLVPLTIFATQVAVLAVGGVVALFAAFRWPFVIAFAALASIVGSSAIEAALGSAGGNIDEALTILCFVAFTIRRIWLDRAIVLPGGTAWFTAFLAVGLFASFLARVPVDVWSQQVLLSFKGFLLAFGLAQLEWSNRRLKALVSGGGILAGLLAITALINAAAPTVWLGFTGANIASWIGGVIPSLSGPYPHPAALGRICAVIGVACVVLLLVRGFRWMPAITLVGVTLIGVLTLRVKTLTSMAIVYLLFALRARSVWLVLGAIALLPIAILTVFPLFYMLVSSDLTAYFFGDEESARSKLIQGAFEIAQANFPLGAGFGRYGSYIAAVEYSPEYVARGWTRVYGLGEGTDWGKYLTDTQWPAILGETGWLGTVLFAGALVAMVVSMTRRIAIVEPALYTWIRWSGIGWILLITIESIGAPVFTSPPAYPFVFVGAGIVAALRYQVARNAGIIPDKEFAPQ